MKNLFKISGVILLILSINLIHSCKKDKPAPTPPTITTTAVTAITYTTATSGGDVTNDGGAAMVLRGVCWNTSADPTIADNKTTDRFIDDPAGGLGSFINYITLLTPNTMYYLRAYATNSVGTAYGNQVSFTTSPVEVPVLTTTEITSVTQTTAVSGGNITADNGGSVTERGVCWGTIANPTIALTTKITNNTGTGVFTGSITGLTAGITYYVRAYATNSAGTGYGNEISFTTDPPTLPVITTNEVSSITTTTAVSGGYVSSDGGVPTTLRGICWNTSQNPTTTNNTITDDGTGIGHFTGNITGLVANTTYYLRAYATNSAGTSYGNELTFKTYTITDIDGNLYHSVTIGTQTWVKENLKVSKYNNGDLIGTTNPATLDITGESTPKYQWAHGGNESNVPTYGRLYTWYAVTDSRNVCPAGWHVPTDAEWTVLIDYLTNNGYGYQGSGDDVAKSIAVISGWTTNTTVGNVGNDQASNNSSGFSAPPAGMRPINGGFINLGSSCLFWSYTEYNAVAGWYRYIWSNLSFVGRTGMSKETGSSIRCLKD